MVSKRRNNNRAVLLLTTEPYRGLSETLSQTVSHGKSNCFLDWANLLYDYRVNG
jgi:hypothetical protein